jgi:hypothetical protein
MAVAARARAAPARPRPRSRPRLRPVARTRARRRTAPRSASAAPARLVPLAVGRRTAVAVGDLADSGLMMRMTRGRAWIGVLAVLLAGIVAVNVASLGLSASTTKIGTQSDSLDRQNSVLRTQLAKQLSDERVDAIAGRLGLSIPQPGEIGYLRAGDQYAAIAARRLESGELSAGDTTQAPPVLAGAPSSSPTASAPTTTAPATSAPTATAPQTAPTPAPAQPTAASPTGGAAGGISAP